MANRIVEALTAITSDPSGPSHTWLTDYAGPDSGHPHQFVLFLKPEATAIQQGVQLAPLLDLVMGTLLDWKIEVRGTRVLRGDYLASHELMDQHYGVINQISHRGRPAITAGAEEKLREAFADELAAGTPVLGGHQFLKEYPMFSPLALCTLSDNLGSTKLGGGTYALRAQVLGRPLLLLNAFHPYQLEPFCAPDHAIVVFECHASNPWNELRRKLAGATNPLKAEKGSIREQFLRNKASLGLADVSQGANGIHLSAGPLEGMVEISRFFARHEEGETLPYNQTTFGQALAAHSFDEATIARLAGNPALEVDGQSISAFDLTEEVDVTLAVEKLATTQADR